MRLRRPSGALIASIIVHAVVGALFVQALVMKRPLFDIFNLARQVAADSAHQVRYVTLGSPGASRSGPPPSGGGGRPVPPPPFVAPTRVPDKLPPLPPPRPPERTPAPSGMPTTGPLIGGNGVLSGIQPHYDDPRLWGTPGPVATVPRTHAEQMDSVAHEDIRSYNDSMSAVAQNQRAPGDWTVKKGGQKYGIDQKFIRLGPISIPTAVLALLPLNVTGNPTTIERSRNFDAMQRDIDLHAHQAMNEAEFQKAVKALRKRKDKERAEREKAQTEKKSQGGEQATSGTTSGSSGGEGSNTGGSGTPASPSGSGTPSTPPPSSEPAPAPTSPTP